MAKKQVGLNSHKTYTTIWRKIVILDILKQNLMFETRQKLSSMIDIFSKYVFQTKKNNIKQVTKQRFNKIQIY